MPKIADDFSAINQRLKEITGKPKLGTKPPSAPGMTSREIREEPMILSPVPGQMQTGQMQTGQMQTGQMQTGQMQKTCSACSGRGYLIWPHKKPPCPYCQGRGYTQ